MNLASVGDQLQLELLPTDNYAGRSFFLAPTIQRVTWLPEFLQQHIGEDLTKLMDIAQKEEVFLTALPFTDILARGVQLHIMTVPDRTAFIDKHLHRVWWSGKMWALHLSEVLQNISDPSFDTSGWNLERIQARAITELQQKHGLEDEPTIYLLLDRLDSSIQGLEPMHPLSDVSLLAQYQAQHPAAQAENPWESTSALEIKRLQAVWKQVRGPGVRQPQSSLRAPQQHQALPPAVSASSSSKSRWAGGTKRSTPHVSTGRITRSSFQKALHSVASVPKQVQLKPVQPPQAAPERHEHKYHVTDLGHEHDMDLDTHGEQHQEGDDFGIDENIIVLPSDDLPQGSLTSPIAGSSAGASLRSPSPSIFLLTGQDIPMASAFHSPQV